jgi:hypothetical protein
MAKQVEFKLNSAGVRELLQSKEMMGICSSYANSALGRLGDGYEVTTFTGKTRVNAEVRAVSYKAKAENLRDNSILKAVHG